MLNPQQLAAVQYSDGPLLVLAGAGSGKTRVIAQKICYLIQQCAHAPQNIFAVTFTNKAAQEMRARVALALPAASRRGLKIATFHTLGLQIIKRDLGRCHLRSGFSIFDNEDTRQSLRTYLPPAQAADDDYVAKVQAQISTWKNDLVAEEFLRNRPQDSLFLEEARELYFRYQAALRAYNAVDLDDLILLPVMLLTGHPDLKEYWQTRIRHLLVDEYQDSNTSQYEFVKLLTGSRAQFTIVGDDDQSIYAWRGARPEHLAELQHDFPSLKVIKLEQNYRSTERILHSANSLIAHNPHLFEKKLWSDLGIGEKLRVLCCKNEQDEAEQVVFDLLSRKLQHGHSYGDYAILYRGNHQSRLFEKVLRHQGISYRLSGGQSWFAKREVKDIFAYLRLLCNPSDDAAFLRVINTPKRGIGDSSLTALGKHTEQQQKSLYQSCSHLALTELLTEKPRQALHKFQTWMEDIKGRLLRQPHAQVLREMVDESGYEAHIYQLCDSPLKAERTMDNVWELIDWVARLLEKKPDQTLSDVINTLMLIDRLEQNEKNEDDSLVQLMTLHASKGLEFPHVYLVGMEEGLLPHRVSIEDDAIEEERRLAYVGITRARKSLCFSLAKQRKRKDGLENCEPSRFLDELPEDCLEWYGNNNSTREKDLENDIEKSKERAAAHLQALKNLLNG